MENIYSRIRDERSVTRDREIEIVPGYKFNQNKVLTRIELYYNGEFETGKVDEEGFDKYFKNVTRPVVLTAEKAIDLDTKDVRPIADDDVSDLAVYFLAKENRQFLRESGFGGLLNKWGNWFPKYGTIVSKSVGGEEYPLNLLTLLNDPRVECLYDSAFVTEEHDYSIADLVNLSKEMPSWENMTALVDKLSKQGSADTIKVYERRGIAPRGWFDGTSAADLVRGLYICADIDNFTKEALTAEQAGEYQTVEQGLKIFAAVSDDFPYTERHWDKIPGRWLGVGEAEIAFDPQVRQNELANLKAKALWWKSKQVFVTADDIIARNLFTDVKNGQVIQSKNGISAIQYNNSDLVAYRDEEASWKENLQSNTFSFDSQVGENLPSGTPYSLGALLAGKSGEFFAKKREEFGLFIRDIMVNSVLPKFMAKKANEHTFNFADEPQEEIEHIVNLAVLVETKAQIEKMYKATGKIPNDIEVQTEMDKARKRLLSRKGLFTKMRKNFYKDAKYHFDYVVTSEQIDLAANLQTLSNVLLNVAKNPGILQNPQTRKILTVIMQKAGVSATELGFDKATAETLTVAGGAPVQNLPPNVAQPNGATI